MAPFSSTSISTSTATLDLYKQEAEKALNQSQQRLGELQKYQHDLEKAAELAEALPLRLSHEVLVPFGKHAFFPGALNGPLWVMVIG